MKKVLLTLVLSMGLLSGFAVADECDNPYVVNVNGDASHPFWGKSETGSYDYLDTNGCLVHVSCYTKYVFWIKVGTSSFESEPLC